MTNHVDVSVIVAVYNSRLYLKDAVSSILRESTSSMEVILVDDGSTDGSGNLCDELAAMDGRIRVIHKENGGMCEARNVAMAQALGDYVTFADNDDVVLPGFVDKNLEIARKYNADVVRFGRTLQRIDAAGNVIRSVDSFPKQEQCVSGEELRANLPLAHYGTDGVWAGLYRSSMLRDFGITFPAEFKSGMEDVWFNDEVVKVAKSCAFNPSCYYVWRRRATHSTSMRLTENRFNSVRKTLELEYQMMCECGTTKVMPQWCSNRIFLLVRDCLTASAYQSAGSKESAFEAFGQVYGLLGPYLLFMRSNPPRGFDNLLFRLLIAKKYALLKRIVSVGVALKATRDKIQAHAGRKARKASSKERNE